MKTRYPIPHWAEQLLRWRLSKGEFEEVQGDLDELYEQWMEEMSPRKAYWLYVWNALTFLRPLPKPPHAHQTLHQGYQANSFPMIHTYFTIAIRNVVRHPSHSLINIAGLSIGIAVCVLLFLLVQFERSFDGFHRQRNQIYRVIREKKSPEGTNYNPGVPWSLGTALRNDFPEFTKVAMIHGVNSAQLDVVEQSSSRKRFKETKGVFYVQPEFFEIFDFTWLSGQAATALSEPNTVVLSRSMANKYFGDYQKAMGKWLVLDQQQNRPLKITGITEDVPANSDFPLKILISEPTLPEDKFNWDNNNTDRQCYVLLSPTSAAGQITAHLTAFARKYLADYRRTAFQLQPLGEIHFDNRLGNYNHRTISREIIIGLVVIGFFLLAVSCINFINLSTALAFRRSKEIGIRKAIGSYRRQLIMQFLSETFVTTLVALLLGAALAAALLPLLKQTLQLPLAFEPEQMPALVGFLLVLLPFITLLAGFYPASVLSGFNPIEALKGKMTPQGGQAVLVRKGLVVFQFLVAQVLIMCTLVVIHQMQYLQNSPWGFNKKSVITLAIPRDSVGITGIEPLRQRLQAQPGVASVSFSLSGPASPDENFTNGFGYEQVGQDGALSLNLKLADAHYFQTYGIEFVAGRPYYPSDTIREVVVNETLLRKVGVTDPEQAIGRNIRMWGKKFPIVGVVRDFHIGSRKQAIAPVLLTTSKPFYWTANIRLQNRQLAHTLRGIEGSYQVIYPRSLFEYQFVEETVASFYTEETKLSNLLKVFVSIAIALSCLGLYGLVSFVAAQRVKEIGIRKVLGASVSSIVLLLTKDFLQLVVIAFAIACPIAWYQMSRWLENFEYKVDLSFGLFGLAGAVSVAIVLLTVSRQSIIAAFANPVKSLKSD